MTSKQDLQSFISSHLCKSASPFALPLLPAPLLCCCCWLHIFQIASLVISISWSDPGEGVGEGEEEEPLVVGNGGSAGGGGLRAATKENTMG